jgi:hypothetical protein
VTQDDLDEIRHRLRRLEQIEQARNFLHTYAQTQDEPDPQRAAELFREDGTLTTSLGVVRGRAAIADFYTGAFSRDTSEKRHYIVNPHTTWLEEGLVRIRSYFLFVGRGDDASRIGWGQYDDTIDVSGERPCFAAKTIDLEVKTDLADGWQRDVA